MVDGHGFILKLYCGEEIRGWLEERGIRERCSLSEEHAGTTAFSLGIKYKRPFRTTGSEHYLSKFIDMTMYFAPCVLEDNSRERFGELELLGGIGRTASKITWPQSLPCAKRFVSIWTW